MRFILQRRDSLNFTILNINAGKNITVTEMTCSHAIQPTGTIRWDCYSAVFHFSFLLSDSGYGLKIV
jgi:hypothetical protein